MKTSPKDLIPSEPKSRSSTKSKVVVILGPTASGKSDLAVTLAQKYNGEVISADSRQVYKGLTIGSGKITAKEMKGVRHHLLDVASPKKIYTADMFQKEALKAIEDILFRGKLPIVCGGTGFYIQALVDNITLPDVKINPDLRKKLSLKTTPALYALLKKADPKRARDIHPHNRPRIIRAIEIVTSLGKVPTIEKLKKIPSPYEFLQVGIETPEKGLKEKISKRLALRIKKGMIAEVANLHKAGLSWTRLEMLGLEYREVARFLQDKLSKTEMIESLRNDIWHYAKRQMTWFKRDTRIEWVQLKHLKKIEKQVAQFLKQ